MFNVYMCSWNMRNWASSVLNHSGSLVLLSILNIIIFVMNAVAWWICLRQKLFGGIFGGARRLFRISIYSTLMTSTQLLGTQYSLNTPNIIHYKVNFIPRNCLIFDVRMFPYFWRLQYIWLFLYVSWNLAEVLIFMPFVCFLTQRICILLVNQEKVRELQ